jgi:hypothetical protein
MEENTWGPTTTHRHDAAHAHITGKAPCIGTCGCTAGNEVESSHLHHVRPQPPVRCQRRHNTYCVAADNVHAGGGMCGARVGVDISSGSIWGPQHRRTSEVLPPSSTEANQAGWHHMDAMATATIRNTPIIMSSATPTQWFCRCTNSLATHMVR